jgi:hypothetical protein
MPLSPSCSPVGVRRPTSTATALGTTAVEASGNPSGLLWLTVAAARAAEARGDAEGVVAQLQPLAEFTVDLPPPEGVQPWRADLVDALVSLGRLDEAEAALATLETRLIGGGAHARTGAGRARGLLAAARGQEPAVASPGPGSSWRRVASTAAGVTVGRRRRN